MARYRTMHMARPMGNIGRFSPTYAEREADNVEDALDQSREELWDAGFETAGGTADNLSSPGSAGCNGKGYWVECNGCKDRGGCKDRAEWIG